MPVLKKMLSTDMLPQGLSERQRFMFFAELFEHFSNTGELDPAEDVPFRAAMNSIHVGTTMLGRCDGTFTTVRREKRQVLATNDDRYCLARNTGAGESRVTHRGREFVMRPGSMALLKLDEPFFAADGMNEKRFTNVHLPMATLKALVAGVDDLVGRELAPGGALSLAMDYSDLLLRHPSAVDEAGFAIASHLMDLAALGLGARGDVAGAAAARRRARGAAAGRADDLGKALYASRIFPRRNLPPPPACRSAMSTNCSMKPAPASPCGCWNCGCARRRTCWRMPASGASATSPSIAASTICPISTAASAAASA